ncbi:aminotransferase class V-fold PLP-dependent enzyme [Pedobacter sp. MC2016-24]|nr:aminotransferase class V-fold PLP-dependent enzyme [Pedobacter sp. MC2016-24]
MTRESLADVAGITVHDRGSNLSGIVTFPVKNVDSLIVKAKLAERGLNVSVGEQQATRMYMDNTGLSTVMPASIHYYNTIQEIATLCRELIANK